MKSDDPTVFTIQQDGGFAKTVELGIEAVKNLLPTANKFQPRGGSGSSIWSSPSNAVGQTAGQA